MNEDSDEALFARHRKQTEKLIAAVVVLLFAVFAYTLYILLAD